MVYDTCLHSKGCSVTWFGSKGQLSHPALLHWWNTPAFHFRRASPLSPTVLTASMNSEHRSHPLPVPRASEECLWQIPLTPCLQFGWLPRLLFVDPWCRPAHTASAFARWKHANQGVLNRAGVLLTSFPPETSCKDIASNKFQRVSYPVAWC